MKANYVWTEPYQAALLQTADEKLPECLRAAKAAIDARLHELHSDHGGAPDERQAICDALAVLNELRRELEGRKSSEMN